MLDNKIQLLAECAALWFKIKFHKHASPYSKIFGITKILCLDDFNEEGKKNKMVQNTSVTHRWNKGAVEHGFTVSKSIFLKRNVHIPPRTGVGLRIPKQGLVWENRNTMSLCWLLTILHVFNFFVISNMAVLVGNQCDHSPIFILKSP